MKKSKTAKKPTKPKTRHLVTYVKNSAPCLKIFNSASAARRFVEDYQKNHTSPYDGYWIDLLITGITGEIQSLDCVEDKS